MRGDSTIRTKWYFDNSLYTAAADSFFYTFHKNGKHAIKAVVTSTQSPIVKTYYDTVSITNLDNLSAGPDVTFCTATRPKLKATGGTNYLWRPGYAVSDSMIDTPYYLPNKTLALTVQSTNSKGCITIDTLMVKSDPAVSVSKDTIICFGNSVKLIATTASSTAVTYKWSPAISLSNPNISSPTASPKRTTIYRVIATSASGCSDTGYVRVGVTAVSAGDDSKICLGDTAQLVATGGNSLTYTWTDLKGNIVGKSSVVNVSPKISTIYVVKSDGAGLPCNEASYDTVLVDVNSVLATISDSTTICRGDTIQLKATGGHVYHWSPSSSLSNADVANPKAFPLHPTEYTVTIEDTLLPCSKKLTVKINMDSSCIWPGDANADGKVNYLDILSIGMGYGTIGTGRSDKSITWHPVTAVNWGKGYNGADYKHADCNGDGKISLPDTVAISKNYSRTHLKKEEELVTLASGIPLKVTFDKSTYKAGDPVAITFKLGTSLDPTHLYGLGYSIIYPSNGVIKAGSFVFEGACDLFCPSGNGISFVKTLPAYYQVDAAIVRNDHQYVKGVGVVANLNYTIDPNLKVTDPKGKKMYIQFIGAKLIDETGSALTLNISSDTAIILPNSTGIDEVASSRNLKIYPNPARNTITVGYNSWRPEVIKIYNSLGQVVSVFNPVVGADSEEFLLNLPEGMYFLQAGGQGDVLMQKLVIEQ